VNECIAEMILDRALRMCLTKYGKWLHGKLRDNFKKQLEELVFGEDDMEWIDGALLLCGDEMNFNRQIREILRSSIRERRVSDRKDRRESEI
jgi:hypothetical protein